MAADLVVRVGNNEPIELRAITVDPDTGIESTLDLTGYTLGNVVLRRHGSEVVITYAATIDADPTTGLFTFTPDSSFVAGVWEAYCEATIGGGSTTIPTDRDFEIRAIERFA